MVICRIFLSQAHLHGRCHFFKRHVILLLTASGSRWVHHAILKTDEWRTIKVSNNKILVDGFFRTDIDPHFIGNDLREPKACTNIEPLSWADAGYGCSTHQDKVERECTKDSVWVEDQYCAQTCFNLGLGYETCLRYC